MKERSASDIPLLVLFPPNDFPGTPAIMPLCLRKAIYTSSKLTRPSQQLTGRQNLTVLSSKARGSMSPPDCSGRAGTSGVPLGVALSFPFFSHIKGFVAMTSLQSAKICCPLLSDF